MRESAADYWMVVETLTAFAREAARSSKSDGRDVVGELNEEFGIIGEQVSKPQAQLSGNDITEPPIEMSEKELNARETIFRFPEYSKNPKPTGPPTDIAAVLTVIRRRSEENQNREKKKGGGSTSEQATSAVRILLEPISKMLFLRKHILKTLSSGLRNLTKPICECASSI